MLNIIGTDEAGYGPNLGALVVSASRWELSDPSFSSFREIDTEKILADFHQRLDPIGKKDGIFPMIDSKKLYHSGGSLLPLEKSVFIALSLIDLQKEGLPSSFRSLIDRICSKDQKPFWEVDRDPELPIDLIDQKGEEMQNIVSHVQTELMEKNIRLVGIRSRRVSPFDFNKDLDSGKLKSDILAETTMSLVVESLKGCRDKGSLDFMLVLCDKLGGRNNYRGLLYSFFPDSFLETVKETSAVSVYRLYPFLKNDIPSEIPHAEIRFTAKGESHFPTALSSIFSKYLRELSMEIFNRYWIEKKKDLHPTAGYPVDARRFFSEIADLRRDLEISDDHLWRKK